MTKKNTQLPLLPSNARDKGPSRNIRNRTNGKDTHVALEDSVRVETKRQETEIDGGNINQGDELDKRIFAAVEKAMPAVIANLKRADEQTNMSEKKQCTCKTFMSYKPMFFSGEEDTMETVNWLEEMNVILHMNDCAEEDKVRFAAHSFKSEALFWWHTILQTQGRDVINKMPWEEFRKLLMDRFCSANELHDMVGEFLKLEMTGLEHKKYTTRFNELARVAPFLVTPESRTVSRYIDGLVPEIRMKMIAKESSTFPSVVDLAARLTDSLVRQRNETGSAKRKLEDTEGKRLSNDGFKKKGFRDGQPRCMKCNRYHYGEFNQQTCCNCNKTGHIARDCTGLPICYRCGAYSA